MRSDLGSLHIFPWVREAHETAAKIQQWRTEHGDGFVDELLEEHRRTPWSLDHLYRRKVAAG